MYLYVRPGKLPLIVEGSAVRAPADPALAHMLSREHSDEGLASMAKEASEEFWRTSRAARRRYGPLGFLLTTVFTIAVTVTGIAAMPNAGDMTWILFIGFVAGVAYAASGISGHFRGLEEAQSKDALIRAHSLRMAIQLRNFDRWWKAYDAAGRPPIDI